MNQDPFRTEIDFSEGLKVQNSMIFASVYLVILLRSLVMLESESIDFISDQSDS